MHVLETLMKSPLDEPRQPGEVDMIDAIESVLRDHSLDIANEMLANAEVLQTRQANAETQKFVIKRFLYARLAMRPDVDTMAARFALSTNTSHNVFLRDLQDYIVPTLRKMQEQRN